MITVMIALPKLKLWNYAGENVLKRMYKVSGIENHVAIGAKLANFITGNNSLKQEWEINPDLQSYVHSDPRLEKIWDISLKLEGTKSLQVLMHADISRHRFHVNSYSPAVLIVNPACLYANMI